MVSAISATALPDQSLVFDLAAERKLVVDVGDLVVGQVGDLLELGDAELVQLLLEIRRDRRR